MGKPTRKQLLDELAELRLRLEEAEDILRAIRHGEVDALVVSGPEGERIFTLKGADHSYRILVETINEGAATLARDGKILYANRRLAELLRAPLEKVVGSFIHDYVAPRDREFFEALLLRVHREDQRQEVRLRTANGAEVPTFFSLSSMVLEDFPETLALVVMDLSEQKRQEEIIAAGRLSRTILEQAEQTIVVCNATGVITQASQGAHRFYGGNLLRQHFEEAFPLRLWVRRKGADSASEEAFSLAAVLQGETYQAVEAVFQRPDGQEFHVLLSAGTLLDENGAVLGCVVSFTDITERKRAEEMLYRQAELLDLAHDAILVQDLLRRITFWNRGATELYGWTREEALGQTFHELLNTEFAESLADIEARLLDQGHWLGELRHMTKDGRRLVISSRWTLRRDAQGKPQSVLVINTDITEQKQAEAALQAANIVAVREKNRLEALMEALPVGVALLDDKGGQIRTNRMFEQVWGEGRPLPREVGDYTHYKAWRVDTGQPMRPEEWASARVVREGKAIYGQSLKIQRFDGTYGYVINSATPILDAQGKVAECAVAILDVTELQEAQETLKERTQRYELVVAGAGAAIWDWDVLNNRVFFSTQWKSLHGYGEDENIHGLKEWSDGLHPEDAPRVLAAVEEHFEGRTPVFAEEYRILCKGGSIKWVFDRGLAQRDESGRVVRMAGSEIDITGRKAAEQALRQSEERLRLALDAAYLISFEWDIQRNEVHRFVSADPTLAQTTEQKPSTFEAVLEAVHPEDRELFKANVCAALQREDGRYENEFRIVHPDGGVAWLYERGYVDRDERGHPVRLIGLSQDITQRKQAEVSLRESREDLNRAQAVAQTGSWRLNVQKNELTWSDENHRIFGIPSGTPMTYETFLSTLHPEDLEFVNRNWQAALKGEPYDIEHRLVVDGQVKWLRERAELEFDQEGRLLGGFGTTQDITHRKEMEEALKAAHARTVAILDSISDSFFALDRDMVVTYYNRAAEKTLGRKSEEVLGKKLFDAFSEARGSIFERKFTEALRTRKALAFEEYFNVPPFENWYDVRVYPFGQGLSVYFQVSTERKKAEEMLLRAHDELEIRVLERTQELQQAYEHLMREMEEHQKTADRLRESEARFTAFMQHLPGPAVMRDVQGRYLFANENWERIAGLERHSWEGKTIDDIWPREMAHKFKALDYEILSTGQATEHIEKLDLPDGRHYFLAHRFPILDERGLPYMVGAIAVDITKRQRAEAALAAERQRLFTVLETMPAYVALIAPDYTVPFATQEFVRRFGEAEKGQRCYEFLFGRTEPCPDCRTFKVFKTNRPEQWEWLGPDGRTYAVYDYPFTDADGSPLILEMGVDITDRKRAELEVRRQTAIVAGINRIFREALTCETHEDLGRACLAVVEELTGSKFGFIDEVNEAGNFNALAFSDPGWEQCQLASGRDISLLHNIKPVGLLAKSIATGESLIANDPVSHPDAAGLPSWHPPLTSFLGVPLSHTDKIIGLIGLGNKKGGFTEFDQEMVEAVAVAIVESLLHKKAEDALKKSEEQLHQLAKQLLEAQETERKRLSRELHDGLGQSLILLKFMLSSINAGLPHAEPEVREECQKALQYLKDIIDEVRRLSRDLSPAALEELGLTSSLKYLFTEFCKHHKIPFHSMKVADVDRLFTRPVQVNIYRILQEILTNIGKHATASKITVTAKRQDSRVSFTVRDNGRGFKVSEVLARLPDERGLGLASMRERLHMMGGTIDIRSRKGAGTTITFTVPIRSD